jgi:two-component system chemotaxis sensor kinase CheA
VRPHRAWSSVRVENGKIDAILEYLGDLKEIVDRLVSLTRAKAEPDEIRDNANAASAIAGHLEEIVQRAGKVPMREEFDRLSMMARDLSTSLGRQIRFVTVGGELLVDRRLPALLSEPLAHLVRNAVDHGIEDPEVRSAAGKPRVGTVTLSAELRGGTLLLGVSDDGRGIDARAVRRRAVALGLIPSKGSTPSDEGTEEAEGDVTAERLLALLIQPGLSTRAAATRVSGRGVGLDLVNERVRGVLGGDLRLETEAGGGTTFQILLPADPRMTSLLVVRWKSRTFAVPERYVERVVDLVASSITRESDGRMRFEGHLVVTIDGSSTNKEPELPAFLLIIDCSGDRAALLVDELHFERDLPEARLELGAEEGKYLSHLLIGGKEPDFLYLNPALLV